jgi:hypothetical protein
MAIHCRSAKHKALMGDTEFKCTCGEFFATKRALSFHVKKCGGEADVAKPTEETCIVVVDSVSSQPPEPPLEPPLEQLEPPQPNSDNNTVLIAELVKQNKQLIDIMSAQTENMASQTEQRDKQIATLVESIQTGGTVNNTQIDTQNIENNTMNHNTQINVNLNLFVDEKCKEAMNLSEFIDQMEVLPGDLQTVLRISNPKALNDIFSREIGKLHITERPLHCIDKKRKKILVKENDEWTSESGTAKMEEVLEATRKKQYMEFARQLTHIHRDDRDTQRYRDIVEVASIVGKPKRDRCDGDPNGRIMKEAMNSMCDAIPLTKNIARQELAMEAEEVVNSAKPPALD